MKRSTTLALVTFALLGFAVAIPPGNAFAQQKEQVSFKATPENSKITQGMNIDVGDAPNHIIRIFEVHRAYPSNAAVIAGLKLVEEWNRGLTEFAAAGHGSGNPQQSRAQSVLPAPSGQGQAPQGRSHRLHAQADRHPQRHADAR